MEIKLKKCVSRLTRNKSANVYFGDFNFEEQALRITEEIKKSKEEVFEKENILNEEDEWDNVTIGEEVDSEVVEEGFYNDEEVEDEEYGYIELSPGDSVKVMDFINNDVCRGYGFIIETGYCCHIRMISGKMVIDVKTKLLIPARVILIEKGIKI